MTGPLPPPPRKVRFTAELRRSLGWGAVAVGVVLAVIFLFGLRAVRGYQYLLDVGKPVQARITGHTDASPRQRSFLLEYRIPGQRARKPYSESVSINAATPIAEGSYVAVTVDPADPDNHLFGRATAEGRDALVFVWKTPFFLVLIAGGCGLAAALLAALRERRVLQTWEFEWAEVVSSEYRHGQRDSSKIVVRMSQGSHSTRTYFLGTISDLVMGDHVDVLYDPSPGATGVRPLDGVMFVEMS